VDENEVTLTLVGGPTVLIEVDGLRLLTDPTFDPPRSYPGPTHLQKLAGPAISADVIGAVDAVLLGHEQNVRLINELWRLVAFLSHPAREERRDRRRRTIDARPSLA
jgi:hypothetical protein